MALFVSKIMRHNTLDIMESCGYISISILCLIGLLSHQILIQSNDYGTILNGYIKGIKCATAQELFHLIENCWNNVPNSIIQNIHSSFKARLQVCQRLGGECLNGHWHEVKRFHNAYRYLI